MLNDRRNERRIGHEGHVPDDGLRREPKGEKGNKEKRGKKKRKLDLQRNRGVLYIAIYIAALRNMKVIEYFYPTETRMPIVRTTGRDVENISSVPRCVIRKSRYNRGIKLSTSKIRLTSAASLLRIVN